MGKKLKKSTTVCYTEPDFAYNILSPEERLADEEKVVAFSAIGQPQQFYKFLTNYDVIKTVDFDDHHNYTQADIEELRKTGETTFITTEKDAGKLLGLNIYDMKIFALKLHTKLDVELLLNEQK